MPNISQQAAEILDKAKALSSHERGQLIDRLVATLDDGPAEEGVEEAWSAEIKRRMDEIESGKAKMIPMQEARRRFSARSRNAKR